MAEEKRQEKSSLGELMIQGAREALAHKRGSLSAVRLTRAKVTARRVHLVPPPEFGQEDVQRVRERLGLSQTVFADLIGASASTVRAWDIDPAPARRLLADYPPGAAVTVHVSAEEAADAILYPELSRRHRSHYMALVAAGLMIIGFAIALFLQPAA